MKTEKVEAFVVAEKALEAFAQDQLGIKFSVMENEFIAHDCELMFQVDGKMEGYDFREVNAMIADKKLPDMGVDLVLDLLCRDNHIPAGLYIVTIRI